MSKYLGIDYGTSKVGLAYSSGGVVSPLEILDYNESHVLEESVLNRIVKIVLGESINHIIIGSPLSYKTNLNDKVIKFVKKLKNRFQQNGSVVEITIVDEKNTSDLSVEEMLRFGISKSKRSEDHSFAAAKILADYLNQISPNQEVS